METHNKQRSSFIHCVLGGAYRIHGQVTDNLISFVAQGLRAAPGSDVYITDISIQRGKDDSVNVFYSFLFDDERTGQDYYFECDDVGDTWGFAKFSTFTPLVFKASKHSGHGPTMLLSITSNKRAYEIFDRISLIIPDFQKMRDDGDTSVISFSAS